MGCKLIIRSRHARTRWEKLCKMVVGDPVHMDIVLAKCNSHSARFCFSAYVNQVFEMCMMDRGMIMDESMENHCLEITDEEYDACMKFLQDLVENKTKYDYVDALLLMPMAPKVLSYPTSDQEFEFLPVLWVSNNDPLVTYWIIPYP